MNQLSRNFSPKCAVMLLLAWTLATLTAEKTAWADDYHIGQNQRVEVRVQGSSIWVEVKAVTEICADATGEWILKTSRVGPDGKKLVVKVPKRCEVQIVLADATSFELPFAGDPDPVDTAFRVALANVLATQAPQPATAGMFLYPLPSAADPLFEAALDEPGDSLGFVGGTRMGASSTMLLVGSTDPSGSAPVVLSLSTVTQSYGLEYLQGVPVLRIDPAAPVDSLNFLTTDGESLIQNYVAFAAIIPEPDTFGLLCCGGALLVRRTRAHQRKTLARAS